MLMGASFLLLFVVLRSFERRRRRMEENREERGRGPVDSEKERSVP
jgi:hypothetical protein